MADVEEISFPRGKPATSNTNSAKKLRKTTFAWSSPIKSEKSVGRSIARHAGKVKKRQSPKDAARMRHTSSGKRKEISKLDAKTAAGFEPLKLTSISLGMLLLGRVKEVRSDHVKLGLPNNLEASVSYEAISTAFSRRLETPPDNVDITKFTAVALEQMLWEGQLLRCKILEVPLETSRPKALAATIAPHEINADAEIQKLREGMLITGAVQSVEDHGYVIELGTENVSGFLNFSNIGDLRQRFPESLQVGQVLLLTVSKIPKAVQKGTGGQKGQAVPPSVIQLSADIVTERKKRDEKTDDSIPDLTIRTAMPGELVTCTVTEIVRDRGLIVKHNKLVGYVSKWHVPVTDGFELKNYAVGQQIEACVLYIDSINNNVHLSLLPHLCDADMFYVDPFEHRSITQVIPDCSVVRASAKMGVTLCTPLEAKSGAAHFVFCSRKYTARIADDTKWLKKYTTRTTHAVAITGYNWMDGMLIGSMRKDDVEQPLFAYEQLSPGQRIHAVVGGIVKSGIVVRLGGRLRGLVPAEHLADVSLNQKHWADKFTTGARVECKVLQVDAVKQKLKLTMKRSLVESTNRMYSDYQQVHTGDLCTGFVVQIRDSGLVVKFLQDVAGFVPRAELHQARVKLDELFYVGQVLNCRVKSFKADRNGIILTPKIGTVLVSSHTEADGSSTQRHNVGDIVECSVIGRKGDTSIQVELLDGSGVQTSISVEHLRDDYTACTSTNSTARRALLGQYCSSSSSSSSGGSSAEQQAHHQVTAVIIRTQPELMLTLKNSFVKMAQEKTLVKSFDDLYEGMTTFAFASMIKEFGLFAEFSNGVRGLLPKKLFRDEAQQALHIKPESLYVGATLPVKVVDINREKQQCLLRLWNADATEAEDAASEGMKIVQRGENDAVPVKKRGRQRSVSTSSRESTTQKTSTANVSVGEKTSVLPKQARSKRVRLESQTTAVANVTAPADAAVAVTTGPDGVLRLSMPDFEWKDIFELDKFNAKVLSASAAAMNADDVDQITTETEGTGDVDEASALAASGQNIVRRTVPQLEQLVAEQPDNVSGWLQYMKYYVDTLADVEQARQVGERALRTMSYRAEAEKRRIWYSLLDLDVNYATHTQLEDRMERAVQSNDPLSIYLHVGRALEQQQTCSSGGASVIAKHEYTDQLYAKMLKKFKHSKEVCVAYGKFLYATGRSDSARKLMQRCLTGSGAIASGKAAAAASDALDKRLHVEIISKFAYFEFAHADRERAKSMMESVLDAYPKRTDVTNVYVDMLIKFNEPLDYVRKVFEKLTTPNTTGSNIPPKKVQAIFKRHVDFEMAHGTPEQVEFVKERARAYVETIKSAKKGVESIVGDVK